jgi:hypothetical protein
MTRGAILSIRIGTQLRISGSRCCIRRRSRIAEGIGFRPRSDSSHERVDLFVGKHSTCTLGEGGHRCARHSFCGRAANYGIVSNGEKNRISQSDGGSALAAHAMASCAVLSIKDFEVDDFTGWHYLCVGSTDAGRMGAGGAGQKQDDGSYCESDENSSTIHCP